MTRASSGGSYQGKVTGTSGLNARVVAWPRRWAYDPAGYAEMRPGVYDVNERVRDMNHNGVLASMCFPTFTGFSAPTWNQYRDPVTLIMVSAYNDWHRRMGRKASHDRFIRLALLPTWNVREWSGDPSRRQEGRARSPCRTPHLEKLPATRHRLGPVFQASSRTTW